MAAGSVTTSRIFILPPHFEQTDEHRGVAAVSVAGDVDARAGAHRHRCRRCNAAAGEGCSESARDLTTRDRVHDIILEQG